MTVIEVIDLTRDLLNEPLDSSRTFPDDSSNFFRDTTLLNYFNREQAVLQNVIMQSFEQYFVTETTINIVDGTDEYALNSSVIKVVRMEWIVDNIEDPIEISPMSLNDKDFRHGHFNGITAVGDITTYALKGDSVLFRPIPRRTADSAVKYFFVKKLLDLASGTSTSLIPETWHEAMSWGIYKRALIMQEGSAESLAVAITEYEKLINQIKIWAENRQIQRPRFVKRRKFRGAR